MEAGEGAAIPAGAAGFLSVIEWVFLISGGCTFAYMLKLFICLFVEKNADPALQEKYDAGAKGYMRAGGFTAVCGTSVLFIVLGQKPVFNALASVMTGHEDVLEEFAPLSFECVKGALISLGIGACLYVLFIRRVLMKNGSYVNLWPEWLDLENLLYRPLLTKWLPGIFGAVLSVPAENKILGRICPAALKGAEAVARSLAISTDALIVLMRRSLLKERVVADSGKQVGRLKKRRNELRKAYEPIYGNFSYALMLSCIGMMVVFGVIMFFNLK